MNGIAGRTVLVVDDDEELRSTLVLVLESEGCNVHQAADGAQALQLMRSRAGLDVMLVDLMMPGMNGWDLLEVVEHDASLRKLGVDVITAGRRRAAVGGRRSLAKPFELEQLLEAVAAACARAPSDDANT